MAIKIWLGDGLAGEEGNFDYDGVSFAISAVADLGGTPNEVRATCADHGDVIAAGEYVTVSGTTDYDGIYEVTNVSDTTHFDFEHAFTETKTGSAEAHTNSNWLYDTGIGCPEPVNSDDVYFEDSSQDVTSGFDQSAIALASLNIAQSYEGQIGDADDYLKIGASSVNIGYHFGPGEAIGSSLLKIDLGTTAATIIVFNSGIPATSTEPAIKLLCNNAATTLEVRKGKVGVATGTGETSTLSTINVSYITSITGDAEVYIGSGVTLTTLTKKGGYVLLLCAATTVSNYNGDLLTEGSGAITTLNASNGTVISNSTGTITNCNISDKGAVDFTKSAQTRTVTNCKVDDEAAVRADPNVITFTNGITSNEPVTLQASAA